MEKKENKFFLYDHPQVINIRYVLKFIYFEILNVFYKSITIFTNKKSKQMKYNVSICAIFKNEAPYLKEWLEFNHLIGIDHFYMYNNNSNDDYLKVLKPYIKKGLVTLVQWPYNQQQIQSYKDCIEKYAGETKWLGFIDIDEFIVPKSTDSIYDFLKPYEKKYGAVNIYWKLYGSSGLINRKLTGLVAEDFTVCWPKYCDIGKCFYNTAFKIDMNTSRNNYLHHNLWTKNFGVNLPPVNVFNEFSFGSRNIAKTKDFPIQINHYFTKSYKEYAIKKSKGDVYFTNNPHDEEYFYHHDMKCTSVDYSAYKYLIKLKMVMKNE